jgi:hypothetical protein
MSILRQPDLELEKVLASFRRKYPDLHQSSADSHCDAFAVALAELLKISDSRPFVIIERTRISEVDESEMDHNPMSHVALEYSGDIWDSGGPGAFARWEADWIQPGEKDEEEPCYDAFDHSSVSKGHLYELRKERDEREPSQVCISKFKAALLACGLKR